MVIGNGLLGNAFKGEGEKYDDFLIFASGVSSSSETDPKQFDRERELLEKSLRGNLETDNRKVIYFSSILTDVGQSKYYTHKAEMEAIVERWSWDYIIFRLPQVVGHKGNDNNIVKALTKSIENDEPLTIFGNVKRSIMDVDDVVKVVDGCKDKVNRKVVNISGVERVNVLELVNTIAKQLNKTPEIHIREEKFASDWLTPNDPIVEDILKTFKTGYTNNVIQKYIK